MESCSEDPIAKKDLNRKVLAEDSRSSESFVCSKEKRHSPLCCSSTRRDDGQFRSSTEHPVDSQTMQVSFPIVEDEFRPSDPIQVSVIDGQVIQLTSRSHVSNGRKSKKIDSVMCQEELRSGEAETVDKSVEKSLAFINSNEKTYILPQGISAEGDYMLSEEVLCEGILPASNMMPEEQILTIPSPSPVELATGTKPDALAIAASEVFSDSCIGLPLQGQCLNNAVESHISESKADTVAQATSGEICHSDSYRPLEPMSFSDCVGVSRLTGGFIEKVDSSRYKMDHIYVIDNKVEQLGELKKNKLLRNFENIAKAESSDDIYCQSGKPPKWFIVPANMIGDSNQIVNATSIANTALEEKTLDPTEKPNEYREKDIASKKTIEYLKPLSVECTLQHACYYEGDEGSDQATAPIGSALRRSPRIHKVKKELDHGENSNSEEPRNLKKRRAVRGEAKRPLWDCVKCDAMFRTKASRNRHMQEGHLFTCYMCKWQGLTKTKYEIHVSTVHCSQKARCLSCRKDFLNYSEYREHLASKHPQVMLESSKTKDSTAKDGMEGKCEEKETDLRNSNQLGFEENVDDPTYDPDEANDVESMSIIEGKRDLQEHEVEEFQTEGKCVCPYCGKKFERHGRFIRHLNYHLGNRAFMCKVCQKSFVEKSGLEAHLMTHSPINEPCPQCGKIFKTHRTMKRHLRTHLNNLYVCSLCPKQFRHEESLRVHKSTHKEGGSGNVCSYCEKDCKTPYYLHLHLANKHEAPKFSCKVCSRSFKWKQSYRKHMVIHNENSSSAVKFKYPDMSVRRLKRNQEKKYICGICGKWFRHEYTREKHIKIVHQEEREHMCPQCGALFKAKAYLDQHLAQVHTTKERVKCQTCGHDFKTESILKSHIKLVHNSTNGKYSCEVCKKTFSAPKDLLRHNKVHTGEKDHICPICRRCFSRKDNMTSHLRTHSRDIQDPLSIPSNNEDAAKDVPQPNAQGSLEILGFSPVVPSSNTDVVTSNSLQPISTPSSSIVDSVTSLVSGSITFSALPLPSISLPSSSLSNTVVYSNSSASSTCIVLSSKSSSTALPVVVFSGPAVSSSHILSNQQPALSSVSLDNIHSNINNYSVSPHTASLSNLSSVTTLTYCNNSNVPLAPSSSNHLYTSPHQASSSTTHDLALSSIASTPTNSVGSCIESVSQEPSVFSSSLHAEQIVLAEEVLASSSTITSQP